MCLADLFWWGLLRFG